MFKKKGKLIGKVCSDPVAFVQLNHSSSGAQAVGNSMHFTGTVIEEGHSV